MNNYSISYLSMLFGLTFIAGIFSSIELGFMTVEFVTAWIFWVLNALLSMLYVRERNKSPSIKSEH